MNKKPLTGPIVSIVTARATVCRGLALAFILLPALSWAQAQQPQAPPEQIVVTGTRLPNPNLISTSPIQVVNAQEISISGKNDIGDLLLTLPQAFTNDLGQDLGNKTSGLTTAGGVSTADLRGLGPNRTLVLVNGRRLGTGSPYTIIQSPAPDLDQIPPRLIERLEVVTGGASAVYGADAVAGVVNFITKKDYEGIEFEVSSGFNWHDNDSALPQSLATDAGFTPRTGDITDGHNYSYSLIGGANSADGRGNFTVYLGYQTQDGVRSGNRDYGSGQLFTDSDANNVPTGDVFMSGSGNSNRFTPVGGTGAGKAWSVLGNQFIPRGSAATTPPAVFNSQQYIFMTREYNRYNAGLLGHYDLNDNVQPYVEFGFMNDRSHQEIAPSALFENSNPLTADNKYLINCTNPLLSAQEQSTICTPAQIAADTATPGSPAGSASVNIGRRNIEGGGRTSDYEHTNYRGVAGVRGEIGPAWRYDAYGQYYYVQFYNTNNRYLNFERITNALQVKTGVGGVPECISGPPCVPYNIFKDGGVTQRRPQLSLHGRHGLRHGHAAHGARRFHGRPRRVRREDPERDTGAVDQRRLRDPRRTSELQAGRGRAERPALRVRWRRGGHRRVHRCQRVLRRSTRSDHPRKEGSTGSEHRRRVPHVGLLDERHGGHLEVRGSVRAGQQRTAAGVREQGDPRAEHHRALQSAERRQDHERPRPVRPDARFQ